MDKIVVGVFGKINSGKSTLVNSLAKESVSIVSNVRGTTSDSVYKMTEIESVGRVKLIDTAGYDDDSALAKERLEIVEKDFNLSDIVIIVYKDKLDVKDEYWINKCKSANKKFILCKNVFDCDVAQIKDNELWLNAQDINQVNCVLEQIKRFASKKNKDILGDLVGFGDNVLLCMPQDEEAPNGRLILPQSITIRAIMDKGGVPVIANKDNFELMFNKLNKDIKLVICDSSVFDFVYNIVKNNVSITSFSVLFAKFNGDINVFIDGANSINNLKNEDKVLIMEVCSHTISHKDIGSKLIPTLIKNYTGKNILFDFARGKDEPNDLLQYKLVIHCGGGTQNSEFMMARINKCKKLNVPITNYGILIAKIKGILDKIVY